MIANSTLYEIGLIPHDIEAMIAYYRDVIGLEAVSDTPLPIGVNRRFAHRGVTIKLLCLNKVPPPPVRGLMNAYGMRLLVLVGDQDWLGEVRARLLAGGHDIARENSLPDLDVLYTRDPDGNTVELVGFKDGKEQDKPVVQLGVVAPDPAALAAAYGARLGVDTDGPIATPAGGSKHIVDWSGLRLNIFEPPESLPAPDEGELHSARAGIRYLTAQAPDVPAACAKWQEMGGAVSVQPMEWRGVACIAFVNDPIGNAIELVMPLDKS